MCDEVLLDDASEFGEVLPGGSDVLDEPAPAVVTLLEYFLDDEFLYLLLDLQFPPRPPLLLSLHQVLLQLVHQQGAPLLQLHPLAPHLLAGRAHRRVRVRFSQLALTLSAHLGQRDPSRLQEGRVIGETGGVCLLEGVVELVLGEVLLVD